MLSLLYGITDITDREFNHDGRRYILADARADYIGSDVVYVFSDEFEVAESLLKELQKEEKKACNSLE